MGYWGAHPIEGDTPLDYIGEVENWLYETLINDIKTEESAGKNDKIPDSLRKRVINNDYDLEKFKEDFFYENYTYEANRELWDTYKYDLIHQFRDEVTDDVTPYFVIPFKFIDYDIHIKPEYVNYLVEMLGDGGAKFRGYSEWDGKSKEDHPMYYVDLTKKYATQIFDESNNELNDDFVAKNPEIRNVVSKGLFESAFKIMEQNGGEVPFMNVQ